MYQNKPKTDSQSNPSVLLSTHNKSLWKVDASRFGKVDVSRCKY